MTTPGFYMEQHKTGIKTKNNSALNPHISIPLHIYDLAMYATSRKVAVSIPDEVNFKFT
jgi:hypothetical protein